MTDGSQAPTIEELQTQLLALQEKQTEQDTKIKSLSEENNKLTNDLNRARELNTKLFLRIPTGENNPGSEPAQEEDSFGKLLDETIEKYVTKKSQTH